MLDSTFQIRDDFPQSSFAQWKAAAEVGLQGTSINSLGTETYEGIAIRPLYTREGSVAFRSAKGMSFAERKTTMPDLRTEHDISDIPSASQAIRDDIEGGATSVLLHLEQRSLSVDDLDALLSGVDLTRVGIAVDGGAAFASLGALLAAVWRRRGVSDVQARGAIGADPLGAWVRSGGLPILVDASLSQLGEMAAWSCEACPLVAAVGVDVSVYHHAGAFANQELAFAIATGVEYLRAMVAAGMTVDAAARQIEFTFRVGEQLYLSLTLLRSAKKLWSRVIEASGGGTEARLMRLHAASSRRMFARRDVDVNLLRNTTAVFAAAIGGADVITPLAFDARLGEADEFSRRLARNTFHILVEEANACRVFDPADGSWFLDAYADELSQRAWTVFQEIERLGGMAKAIQSGWVADQVDAAYAVRARDIESGKTAITGVTIFPSEEARRASEGMNVAPQHPSLARRAGIALPERPLAAPIEGGDSA